MNEMRIMTTNIWGDYFSNPVNVREEGIYKVYEAYCPDVIGFQEITDGWYNSNLFGWLSDKYYLVGTELSNNTNYVPVAVKKEYELVAKGYEMLRNTPDKSKAITWAVIKHKENENVAAVLNTHFWWMTGKPEYDAWRNENATQLSELMKYLKDRFNCPVFAFGDMNCNISHGVFTEVYKENGVELLYDMACEKDDVCTLHGDPVADENGLYHGKTTDKDHTESIDHIVSLGRDGFKVLSYRVVTEQYILDATDHSPVFADIEFE